MAEAPLLTDHEVYALKALAAGKASEGQQRLSITAIVVKFAGAYDLSYRSGPNGDRDTVFAEGKRFVGQRILEATTRPMKQQGAIPDGTRTDIGTRRNPKPTKSNPKPAKPEPAI